MFVIANLGPKPQFVEKSVHILTWFDGMVSDIAFLIINNIKSIVYVSHLSIWA